MLVSVSSAVLVSGGCHFWMTWVLRVRMLVSVFGAVLVSVSGATFG